MKHLLSLFAFAVITATACGQDPVAEKTLSVERAARRYRIYVYESFRTDRTKFNRRIEAAQTLIDLWRDAGEPETRRAELVEWFQRARADDLEANAFRLPALPNLALPAASAPGPVAAPSAPGAGAAPSAPGAGAAPSAPGAGAAPSAPGPAAAPSAITPTASPERQPSAGESVPAVRAASDAAPAEAAPAPDPLVSAAAVPNAPPSPFGLWNRLLKQPAGNGNGGQPPARTGPLRSLGSGLFRGILSATGLRR